MTHTHSIASPPLRHWRCEACARALGSSHRNPGACACGGAARSRSPEDYAAQVLTRRRYVVVREDECDSPAWWAAAATCRPPEPVAAVFEELAAFDSARVSGADLERVVRWAATLPAWDSGPAHAPHPILWIADREELASRRDR